MKKYSSLRYTLPVLCLYGAAFSSPAPASVLTPGENPGQYSIQVYIQNDSDLPYPSSGLVGDGFVRYESDWLDRQLAAWAAWAACDDQPHDEGECDELYAAIDLSGDSHIVTFDVDKISFDMLGLVVDARFEMYGVVSGADDVTQWREVIAVSGSGFMSIATLFEMVDGGNSIFFGAGDEEYNAQVRLNGHYGSHDLGGCYAQDPDGSWTEDLCYDISVDPVVASVAEPDAVLLVSLALLAFGFVRRNESAA